MVTERVYNVPLRKEFLKAPRYKRAKKAVSAVRSFLERHMKSKDTKIGKYLNKKIWEHGIKNPPHHILVNAVKDDKGTVTAELVGAPVEKVEERKKKEKKKEETKEEKKEKPKETAAPEKKETEKPKPEAEKAVKEEKAAAPEKEETKAEK